MSKKEIDRSKLGQRNKRKGSTIERYYAKFFRDTGVEAFSHCKTSRMGSKLHDDAGIDLIFLPFNVQIKAGIQKGMKPVEELRLMKERMKELFPDKSIEHDLPKIVIHYKDVGKGKKRTEFDEVVTMTFSDFCKLIDKIKEW